MPFWDDFVSGFTMPYRALYNSVIVPVANWGANAGDRIIDTGLRVGENVADTATGALKLLTNPLLIGGVLILFVFVLPPLLKSS